MTATVTGIHDFIELKAQEASVFDAHLHPSAAGQISHWIGQAREHFLDLHEVARLLRLIDEEKSWLRFSAENAESANDLAQAVALRDCAAMFDGATSRWPAMCEETQRIAI